MSAGNLPVTVIVNVADSSFPLVSVAVKVTVVMPIGNVSPELKFEDIVTDPKELSLPDGCCQDTIAVGRLGSVLTTKFSGTSMKTGFSSSVFKHTVHFYDNYFYKLIVKLLMVKY